MDFIIGNGVVSNIVQYYIPQATVIAPSKKSFLPIQYLWKTQYTKKFLNKYRIPFEEKERRVKIIGNNFEKYNFLTKKPENNKPSLNKKKISVYEWEIKQQATSIINDKVIKINLDTKNIYTTNNKYEYERLFVASPLTFEIESKGKKYNSFYYYPLKFIEFSYSRRKYREDIIYLLEDKYLNKRVFRLSYNNGKAFLETTDINFNNIKAIDIMYELFLNKILNEYVMKYAQFRSKKLPFLKDAHFVSRHSRFDNEWLLSDTIKYLELLQDEI